MKKTILSLILAGFSLFGANELSSQEKPKDVPNRVIRDPEQTPRKNPWITTPDAPTTVTKEKIKWRTRVATKPREDYGLDVYGPNEKADGVESVRKEIAPDMTNATVRLKGGLKYLVTPSYNDEDIIKNETTCLSDDAIFLDVDVAGRSRQLKFIRGEVSCYSDIALRYTDARGQVQERTRKLNYIVGPMVEKKEAESPKPEVKPKLEDYGLDVYETNPANSTSPVSLTIGPDKRRGGMSADPRNKYLIVPTDKEEEISAIKGSCDDKATVNTTGRGRSAQFKKEPGECKWEIVLKDDEENTRERELLIYRIFAPEESSITGDIGGEAGWRRAVTAGNGTEQIWDGYSIRSIGGLKFRLSKDSAIGVYLGGGFTDYLKGKQTLEDKNIDLGTAKEKEWLVGVGGALGPAKLKLNSIYRNLSTYAPGIENVDETILGGNADGELKLDDLWYGSEDYIMLKFGLRLRGNLELLDITSNIDSQKVNYGLNTNWGAGVSLPAVIYPFIAEIGGRFRSMCDLRIAPDQIEDVKQKILQGRELNLSSATRENSSHGDLDLMLGLVDMFAGEGQILIRGQIPLYDGDWGVGAEYKTGKLRLSLDLENRRNANVKDQGVFFRIGYGDDSLTPTDPLFGPRP